MASRPSRAVTTASPAPASIFSIMRSDERAVVRDQDPGDRQTGSPATVCSEGRYPNMSRGGLGPAFRVKAPPDLKLSRRGRTYSIGQDSPAARCLRGPEGRAEEGRNGGGEEERIIMRPVVAVLAIVGVVACSVTRDSRSKRRRADPEGGPRATWSRSSRASGEIKPKKFVNVSANVSGPHHRALVKEGDTVRKGQVLARIDSTRFEAGEQQSRGGRAGGARRPARAREADLENARLASSARRRCTRRSSSPTRQFEQADADVKMKTAALDAQRRRIRSRQRCSPAPRRPRARRWWSRPWTASSPASRRSRARWSSAPRASRPP